MNILVLGSGAREHSICWAIKKSKTCNKLFCSPGNAGIQKIAECKFLDLKKKIKILNFCEKKSIDLVIIGPEEYLADGVSDYLQNKGIKTFGPVKKAAKLETSKSFAKSFLFKNKILTPKYRKFTVVNKALNYLNSIIFPIVIKADGLAAGKGVIICKSLNEAEQTIKLMMEKKKFGDAGKKIIIEEFIDGFEISYFSFFDKKTFLPLGYALDHKRAFDNDLGPNTGGMGCFTPSKKVSKNLEKKIIKNIIEKTFLGFKKESFTYRGILFFGLIIKNNEPYVIEYNVRFGDPECQTLLRKLNTDFLEIITSITKDELGKIKITNSRKSVICVVLASKGYPESYNKEILIPNLQKIKDNEKTIIFHAGTKTLSSNFFSNGGRVLSVTSTGKNIEEARKSAYKVLKKLNWKDGFYRKDIGLKNF
ncbi:MAG: phosphoribosylamine--glycine ligase [Rickettsiales bacterium]|nr:phosphoribosylamine--glycine ligase [Rickettsiales bacterium]RPG15671.1 MAG: phosphoribosylamine--glycine ligase [Pelagibacteraceae bacterium TMED195]